MTQIMRTNKKSSSNDHNMHISVVREILSAHCMVLNYYSKHKKEERHTSRFKHTNLKKYYSEAIRISKKQ